MLFFSRGCRLTGHGSCYNDFLAHLACGPEFIPRSAAAAALEHVCIILWPQMSPGIATRDVGIIRQVLELEHRGGRKLRSL